MAVKRKVTITIDDDLARELESGGGPSAQLNEAGWVLLERRRRADRLDRTDGPLADDPDEDARIVGGVLAGADGGSSMIVEAGGGVVVTGDVSDLGRLAAPCPHVVVERI